MNLGAFLDHWQLTAHPFLAEEARNDDVLRRLTGAQAGAADPGSVPFFHPAFDKVQGELGRPASAIVFGEKGSGKTAIRLQIIERVRQHNLANGAVRVAVIAYDDLNAPLDRFCQRVGGTTAEALAKLRTGDHIDGMLLAAVPALVDGVLGARSESSTPSSTLCELKLSRDDIRAIRSKDASARQDLMLLASAYDRQPQAPTRLRSLSRVLGVRPSLRDSAWRALALVGWLPAAVLLVLLALPRNMLWSASNESARWAVVALASLWALAWLVSAAKVWLLDRVRVSRLARRTHRSIRMGGGSEKAMRACIAQLPSSLQEAAMLPTGSAEDVRFAMLDRLRRVLASLGYPGVLVLVDRVDEPTIVRGDAERMRQVVWPMLSNKLLQHEGVGVKLLLPIELRYALLKESSAFFQEARLDKQSMVDRLSWTGPMLHDLCEARLRACRKPGAGPVALADIFEEDIGRQELVDALERMHQPRDAMKFLYACVSEHCATVVEGDGRWRISRAVFEGVRRAQAERVAALERGIAPA